MTTNDPITSLRAAVARATDEAMGASDPDLIRAQVLALGAEVLVALPFVTGDAATIANYARVADAMTARALAAEERADAADAPDLDYPAREALWKMRDERDAAIAEAESLRGELDALAEKLGAATLERDAARAEADRLRALPRLGQPTRAEWDAHRATGGEWICVSPGPNGGWDCGRALIYEPAAWLIPVRDGLPCAWPVVAAEGGAR